MEIKVANKKDFERLEPVLVEVELHHVALEPEVFQPITAYDNDHYNTLIDNYNEIVFYAEINGAVAGVLIAVEREYLPLPIYVGGAFVEVNELSVSKEFQRMGVGKALMERAELWAKSRGHSKMKLGVWAKNQGAVRFYEELGYTPELIRYRKKLD